MSRQSERLDEIDAAEVDKRLADGWTLPAAFYTSELVAEVEAEIAWKRGWHVVGTVADLKKPGDFLTAYIAQRYPVLVTRDRDNELHGFINVCKHRGCLVVGGERGDRPEGQTGNTRRLTCPYHSWTYDLTGALVGIPESKGLTLPPREEISLDPVSVGVWGGAVFVSIDPDEPLEQLVAGIDAAARGQGYTFPFLDPDIECVEEYAIELEANWKVYLENNLECYHCGACHGETLGAICTTDLDGFFVLDFDNGHYFRGEFTDRLESAVGEADGKRMREIVAETGIAPQQQYWLWPGSFVTTGLLFGDAVFRIDPLGPNRCRLVGRAYARPDQEEPTVERLRQYLLDVIEEDRGVSQGTQIGLRAGTREYGPMLGKREQGVNCSNRIIWERLSPAFRRASDD